MGSKKNPIWRVVVADQRSPRDGRVIETIGRYNAQTEPSGDRARRGAPPALARPRRPAHQHGEEADARQGASTPPPSRRGGPARVPRARAGRRPRRGAVEAFEEDDGTLVLELTVADDDVGKIIGRHGRTVNALRTGHARVRHAQGRRCSSTWSIDRATAGRRGRVGAPTASTAASTSSAPAHADRGHRGADRRRRATWTSRRAPTPAAHPPRGRRRPRRRAGAARRDRRRRRRARSSARTSGTTTT